MKSRVDSHRSHKTSEPSATNAGGVSSSEEEMKQLASSSPPTAPPPPQPLSDMNSNGAQAATARPPNQGWRSEHQQEQHGRPLAEYDIQTVCDLLCPDALLPSFRRVPTVAAEILQRYQLSAAARSEKMLNEMKPTDSDGAGGEGAEDVGVAVEQLAQACEAYVKRYKKRMELLQQYSEDAMMTTGSATSSRGGAGLAARRGGVSDWCRRVQDYYARPLSTLQGRAIFIFHAVLCMATLTSITLQTLPTLNPMLHSNYASTWVGVEGAISGLMLVDVLVIFLANLFDPLRPVSQSLKLYVFSLSNCLDVAALILPTIRIASANSYGVTYVSDNVTVARGNVTVNATVLLPGNNFRFDSDGELEAVMGEVDPFLLFRLLRVYRMMVALRHFYAFEDLFETLRRSAVPLIGPVVAVLIFVVGFASIVYTMEAGSYLDFQFMVRDEDCEMRPMFVLGLEVCPRTESKFLSIFHSMWFALIALLTIGYGDMLPKTLLGRMVSLVCIVLGQLLMAMPIAIIGNKFTYVVTNLKAERRAVLQFIDDRQLQHAEDAENLDTAAAEVLLTNGGGEVVTTTTKVNMSAIIGGSRTTNEVASGGHLNRGDVAESDGQPSGAGVTFLTFSDDIIAALHREQASWASTHATTTVGHEAFVNGKPSVDALRKVTVPLVIPGMTTRDHVQEHELPRNSSDDFVVLGSVGADGSHVDEADPDGVLGKRGPTRVAALPTLPSVMFCRYLQFSTKQQTLDLVSGDRLVVYAVEKFLRHAAKNYLRHVTDMNAARTTVPNSAAATPVSRRDELLLPPPGPSTQVDSGRGLHTGNTTRHLVLVHSDVSNVVELPSSTTLHVGEDPQCDVQLRAPLVRALAMSLYSEKPKRALNPRLSGGGGALGGSVNSATGRWDGAPPSLSSGAKLSSAGRATPNNIALRQSYTIAPHHCNITVWQPMTSQTPSTSTTNEVTNEPASAAAAATPLLFLKNPHSNTVFVNGQSIPAHTECHLKDGDVIRYAKVSDAVSTAIGSTYAYDFDVVVRGRNE